MNKKIFRFFNFRQPIPILFFKINTLGLSKMLLPYILTKFKTFLFYIIIFIFHNTLILSLGSRFMPLYSLFMNAIK